MGLVGLVPDSPHYFQIGVVGYLFVVVRVYPSMPDY